MEKSNPPFGQAPQLPTTKKPPATVRSPQDQSPKILGTEIKILQATSQAYQLAGSSTTTSPLSKTARVIPRAQSPVPTEHGKISSPHIIGHIFGKYPPQGSRLSTQPHGPPPQESKPPTLPTSGKTPRIVSLAQAPLPPQLRRSPLHGSHLFPSPSTQERQEVPQTHKVILTEPGSFRIL